jgi:hypothetical protein
MAYNRLQALMGPMSALGQKRTNHRGPKSTFVRFGPKATNQRMRREVGCHQPTPMTIERWHPLISRALTMRGDHASAGVLGLSIEVPAIFGCPDPHPLCLHEVFFNAQSCRPWRTWQRQISMSALPPKADIDRWVWDVR